jgi:LuxR family transcriptional activator of conjugal transfer of Ti plasmids
MHLRTLLGELIDSTFFLSTGDALKEALAKIAARHDFERFAYLSLEATSPRSFAVSNYPEEWQSLYFGRHYMVVDPVVTIGKRIMHMFHWCADEHRRRATKDERGFWDAASAFDIRAGVTVPVRGPFGQVAMLTFASAHGLRAKEFNVSECVAAATAVAYLNSRYCTMRPSTMLPRPVLSDREILCLRWIAAGKTMSDIAQLSGLTYRTVRWDLDNVRAKLNVKNIKQALVLALELGML